MHASGLEFDTRIFHCLAVGRTVVYFGDRGGGSPRRILTVVEVRMMKRINCCIDLLQSGCEDYHTHSDELPFQNRIYLARP